jgi:hypothetical protein
MSRYIPFPAYPDTAPVDLRFVYEGEAPAGKHGFLKIAGDHFEFEDGAPARFWGANFNSGANFPDFGYADKVAERLAKIGCNIVRFHQLDSEWATPNIFQFTKGKRQDSSTELDPESMKRLDYLISALKRNGIYCYLDMMTYRKFKSGDGVANAYELLDAGQPYGYYNPKLIELQKKFMHDVWTHVNPYTGLAYKDEPAIVLSEIVNEIDLFSRRGIIHEPYVTEFRKLFAAWLKENGMQYDAMGCDLFCSDAPLVEFKMHVQEKYYREMSGYMRNLGVKIPIAGTNWTINGAVTRSQRVNDYHDGHVYFYDWKWGERVKSCMNRGITEVPESGFAALAFNRHPDRPYFISEWDMPWPNEFRAESPILYAAVGGLQNWSGFTIHTYAYSSRLENMEILGKEISASSIGGVPYREGIFAAWNDPAKFGLFYHSALITRRGDVAASKGSVAMKIGTLTAHVPAGLDTAPEYCRGGTEYDGYESATAKSRAGEGDVLLDTSAQEVRSDTGELYRNWEKNFGTIDTPRTKCAYGFLGKNGTVALDGLAVKCKTDFAVVAMSSLSDLPLDKTDNILLTAVGRARNADAKFEGEQMLDYGRPPILIEVIEAQIELKTERRDLVVWGVNAEGYYVGRIPTAYENGVLKFKLGDAYPSMYYLIRAE